MWFMVNFLGSVLIPKTMPAGNWVLGLFFFCKKTQQSLLLILWLKNS